MIRSRLGVYFFVSLLIAITGCRLFKSVGRNPNKAAVTKLEEQPNYKNGSFENLAEQADTTKKRSLLFLRTHKPKTVRPSRPMPWVKTDLNALTPKAPTVVWFGHSSLLIKTLQGNILIDPIFNNHAGPIPGVMRAFAGTGHYHAEDMPPIDVLLISHDHYDHLDYQTVKRLKSRVKLAVVPLGVGSNLIYWGFDPKKIIELNWNQSTTLPGGLQITATKAQHKSNRTYSSRNKTLWASYVIQSAQYKIFYSGDSGYGPHFKEIGEKYGPFDLALLECGQYSPNYPWTHLWIGQAAQAAIDLNAKMLQPVHWGKFVEASHPWNEAVEKLVPAAGKVNMPFNVPKIGEPYTIGDPPKTDVWWNFR
ncbi:MBL fold metallo-hydrolase [Mucilaginibacter sp. 21P]|uniref:MBL fold metallo-hydrolase n=1 Tax=Mucilaginibacter sp. 21P TaxID=2778902 RepID=UPI001C5923F9|nr:MBL fold metallo-hydrolase [Mucilaginibacter sp. 21P]QXV65032.1 MBL fold metallo-hydrolase [Mucilaginibacter sp. 21P]